MWVQVFVWLSWLESWCSTILPFPGCSNPRPVTFQNGYGGFTQTESPLDDFDWLLTNDETGTLSTGPIHDHTLGTSQGLFAYIDSSLLQAGLSATLTSPMYRATSSSNTSTCHAIFWYSMVGAQVSSKFQENIMNTTGIFKFSWSILQISCKNYLQVYRIFPIRSSECLIGTERLMETKRLVSQPCRYNQLKKLALT